jgi:cysteine desulfurase
MASPRRLYFDYAATTPLHPQALEAMLPFLGVEYGNPSGMYGESRFAKKAVNRARAQVAEAINASPGTVYFTGGGTESDNWAIKGAAEALRDKGRHIVTTSVEHHAVLYPALYLREKGFDVTLLPVDGDGFVSPASLEETLRPDTVLVSVIMANNETGAIQPLADISRITRRRGIVLHTDAVQAVGHIPVDTEALGVDMLSLSAHKFYGPKGVGALYIREGTPITPLLHGGAQESNRRAGTENTAGIVGMGEAAALAVADLSEEAPRLTQLRDRLLAGLEREIPDIRLNGPRWPRLPGNVNVSFGHVEGEALMLLLDMQGCSVSTGSACTSGSQGPSHVLTAMGVPPGMANAAVRFTMGRHTGEGDVDALLALLPDMVKRIRGNALPDADFLKLYEGR